MHKLNHRSGQTKKNMEPKNESEITDPSSISYEMAFDELKEIAASIENESISLDILALKVGRASELIRLCQQKLRSAETEVNQIIHDLGKEN